MRAILENSSVLYSRKAMKDGEVFERPSYNEFMIPRDDHGNNKILASVYKEISGQEAEESNIMHRISCMKYTQCQKIDDYIYIDELENVYNRSNSKCGLHLYENTDTHWAHLPSPVYRDKHADYYTMNRYDDAKLAEKYRYVFYKAFDEKHPNKEDPEHGIITYDTNTKKMCISITKLKEKYKENHGDANLLNLFPKDENIFICNMENNESENGCSYVEYCADWFVKMFKYRDLVAKALNLSLDNITDNDMTFLVSDDSTNQL